MNILAQLVGYTVIVIGGVTLAILIVSVCAWQTFEFVAKHVGWAKSIREWIKWKREQRLGG